MSIEYVLTLRDAHRSPTSLSRTMRRVRRTARAFGGPWRMRVRGGVFGRTIPELADALDRFKTRLAQGSVGEVLVLEGTRGSLSVRVVEVAPPLIQTQGNSRIDAIYSAVVRAFKVANYGICSRRQIANSSSWTQHCPWPPPDPGSNAWDIGAAFSLLSQVRDFLAAQALAWQRSNGKDGLPIGRWIFNRQIWDPVQGIHYYGGEDPHTGHIHVEGLPERTGQPRASCP